MRRRRSTCRCARPRSSGSGRWSARASSRCWALAGENATWIKVFAALIILAIVAAGAVFVTFVFTTLIHEPASIVTLLVILVLSIGLDYGGKRNRPSHPVPVQVGP